MASPHWHVGLLTMAQQFATVAMKAKSGDGPLERFNLVHYYLLSHSLELGLKSFLAAQGFEEPALRKIGHDLVRCLDEATTAGLDARFLEPEAGAVVAMLNQYYAGKELEYYSQPMMLRLPEAEPLERVVNTLLRGLRGQYAASL